MQPLPGAGRALGLRHLHRRSAAHAGAAAGLVLVQDPAGDDRADDADRFCGRGAGGFAADQRAARGCQALAGIGLRGGDRGEQRAAALLAAGGSHPAAVLLPA